MVDKEVCAGRTRVGYVRGEERLRETFSPEARQVAPPFVKEVLRAVRVSQNLTRQTRRLLVSLALSLNRSGLHVG